jgi:ferric-dicitrate binding protein FerR (iron transport regulator)
MDTTQVAYLFKRCFHQTATEEEKAALMEWMSRKKNAEEAKMLMDHAWKEFQDTKVVFTEGKSEEMLRQILYKDTGTLKASAPGQVKRFYGYRIAAAAVVLALLATGLVWFITVKPKTAATYHTSRIADDVAPGGNKATLTLANGTAITLNNMDKGQLTLQGNSKVVKADSSLLVYSQQDTDQGQKTGNDARVIQYNTLTTPRGGQYQLVLPDGSKVWLNAASSIHFPTAFTGKERKVEITGEVYFEVAKNANMPFIVKKDNAEIQVLGTSFNINAYQDEPVIKITLLKGSVKVSQLMTHDSQLIKPGQQADIDKKINRIKVSEANIDEVIAWKNGLFHFEGDDMPSIMRKIARWYDVKVTYENTIPSGHYTGVISRNTNLSAVLKMLELSGVHFKIDGMNILVM